MGDILIQNKYYITTRHLVLSGDLNYSNTLFGGKLLQWIDESASLYCIKQMDTERIVTLKLSEMMFKTASLLSDMLIFYCRTIKEGNSSLHIELYVFTEAIGGKKQKEICHCELVFVAVDQNGKKTPWIKQAGRNDWQNNNFSYLPH